MLVYAKEYRHVLLSWHPGTIRYIIGNERYIGDALLQKGFNTDTLPYRARKNRGEKKQYYVENAPAPIVSRNAFASFLGYRKGEDGKPEIVESEAEIIRRIYAHTPNRNRKRLNCEHPNPNEPPRHHQPDRGNRP